MPVQVAHSTRCYIGREFGGVVVWHGWLAGWLSE